MSGSLFDTDAALARSPKRRKLAPEQTAEPAALTKEVPEQPRPAPPPTSSPTTTYTDDQLGKLIQNVVDVFHSATDWTDFISKMRGASEFASHLEHLQHPAGSLLHRLQRSGVPVLQSDAPWSQQRKHAAMARGSHQSTREHSDFLREEMAEMMMQRFWIVIPYDLVQHIPGLRISPLGVVPQRDRRPRIIVDFSFSGVNQHTVSVAPYESMQFGRAFERLLHKIHHANPHYGPVYMIKIDLSDGFYRMPLSSSHLPALGVVFPHRPGEVPLVALPLVLPMGWVASPPYFCAITETVADLANAALSSPTRVPSHPLSTAADNPQNPVLLRSAPATQVPLASLELPRPPESQHPLHQPSRHARNIRTKFAARPPFQLRTPTTPLAYIDVYMDDFLGLAQGHPALRNQVRSKLLMALDQVLRPLADTDRPFARKQPVSMKKLDKGDGAWTTRKLLLGWIVDTVRHTIELPPHRIDKLHATLSTLLHCKRVALKRWQQALGELRSMILAIPGGRGLFSTLYTGLTNNADPHRVRISTPLRHALADLQLLANDLSARPTRFGEIVDSVPAALGTADASGAGMGGVWFSGDPSFSPVVWRSPFPSHIQARLITYDNPSGTITNSDLELAAQIAAQDILVQQRDCRERTITTFTDNVATRAWHRKGSRTTLGPAAYLLRLLSLHQRYYRYRATIDYLPGPLNVMADDASRLWHLSDDAFLSHFNSTYPQPKPWTLSHPRPVLLSALTTALLCKHSELEWFHPEPNQETPTGFDGSAIATTWASTLSSPTPRITFRSSKCLPSVIDVATFPPPLSQSALVPWRQRSAPLARRWPAWGPQISA